MYSAYTDPELRDWLRWNEEHGSNFMRALATAALVADLKAYNLLRPVLLKLKQDENGVADGDSLEETGGLRLRWVQ